MKEEQIYSGLWQGFVPPQYIFAHRRFKCVALDPPDFNPGSWIGAGKLLFDHENKKFLLTARPRKAEGNVRGFAANIYVSEDGENFELVTSIKKEEISEKSRLKIHSIEGTQLLKSPLTGKWHFYLSVDTGEEFVWGGIYWQTLLLTASDLKGPWHSEGIVLKNDKSYDAAQARDATIDIIDGVWFCLYKAVNEKREERPALAISEDGINWKKLGCLTLDKTDTLVFLSGSIFSGTNGPLFIGLETKLEDSRVEKGNIVYADKYKIGHGGGPVPNFVACNLDYRNMNLEIVFRQQWKPLSPYEHKEHPLLGYASLIFDPFKNRVLMSLEAIDGSLTKQIGLNETVERVLIYETPL